uniref:Ig-like domain-containing protein n=1 Tax=Paramormyrops kingsleyae TaxID=1676925 RepID=A0A3B3RB44_9TELE
MAIECKAKEFACPLSTAVFQSGPWGPTGGPHFCSRELGESKLQFLVSTDSHNGFSFISWTVNGSTILTSDGTNTITYPVYNGRINFDITTGSLELKSLTLHDSGSYQVQIQTSGESEFNDSVSLTCSASGSSPTFHWLNGSSDIIVSERVHLSADNRTFTISPVLRFDQEPIYCSVTNIVSNTTRKAISININCEFDQFPFRFRMVQCSKEPTYDILGAGDFWWITKPTDFVEGQDRTISVSLPGVFASVLWFIGCGTSGATCVGNLRTTRPWSGSHSVEGPTGTRGVSNPRRPGKERDLCPTGVVNCGHTLPRISNKPIVTDDPHTAAGGSSRFLVDTFCSSVSLWVVARRE